MRSSRTSLLILMVGLLATSGCMLYDGSSGAKPSDLQQARARWASLGWDDYNMDMMLGCFCVGAGELRVLVRDGEQVAVIPTESYWSNSVDWWQWIPTVEDLFDEIERALVEAADVQVTYSEWGYPEEVSIDWIAEAIDDEIAYSLRSVEQARDSEVHRLKIGDTASVGDGVFVTFSDLLEDSRCAHDAQCIWPGRAVGEFTFSTSRARVLVQPLFDGAVRGDDESNQVGYGPFEFTLLVVSPYPERAGTPIERHEYAALLLAERE